MKKKIILLIFIYTFFVFSHLAYSQSIEKIALDSKDSSLYYLAVKPLAGEIKGVLILLPGFGEQAEAIFPETKLHNVACVNNILTIGVEVGNKIYADKAVLEKINLVLNDILKRFKVKSDSFVMGGFSAGGTISLRLAELMNESPQNFPISLKGVFAVDSPVDLVGLWNYFDRELAKNFSQAGTGEANFIQSMMKKEFGTPQTNLTTYIQLSPFYAGQKGSGSEQFLKSIAVRVYHDIDVAWQLKNRRRSLYDTNQLNSSEMINRLLLLGNEKAEFVQGKTGYRSNGMRHTHSWSIVDEVELIQWMKNLL
jgi:pimeloyl-ACP methyl ester carboxylesterase